MKKYVTSKGRYAKAKGNRAERQWVTQLRRIYPDPRQREHIKRVPMSGASWMKGDVIDLNDIDTLYEVKNQESLRIPEWWRQAVREAGNNHTPVLVITQNFRPFYVFMSPEATEALLSGSIMKDRFTYVSASRQAWILEFMDEQEPYTIINLTIPRSSDTTWTVMRGGEYIELKKSLC